MANATINRPPLAGALRATTEKLMADSRLRREAEPVREWCPAGLGRALRGLGHLAAFAGVVAVIAGGIATARGKGPLGNIGVDVDVKVTVGDAPAKNPKAPQKSQKSSARTPKSSPKGASATALPPKTKIVIERPEKVTITAEEPIELHVHGDGSKTSVEVPNNTEQADIQDDIEDDSADENPAE